MENDYIIIQVSRDTQVPRNWDTTEDDAKMYVSYKVLINFLQDNGLTTREILPKDAPVVEETCIKKSDLTEEGFELFRKEYIDRWTAAILTRKKPVDAALLEKYLKKIRAV